MVLCLGVTAAAASKDLTARQILERAARHYDVVNDYTVNARLTVESPSVHVPEMPVKIYYKKPDKLHVESEDGFAMLPRQGVVLGNPIRDFMSGADISLAGSEKVLGHDCYVVRGSYTRDGRAVQSAVWVDKKQFLVRQIHANPEWGPSIKIKLWYTRVALRYWMPSTSVAQVSLPPLPDESSEQSAGRTQKGQPTMITLKFSDYRVNKGLNDKIFKQERGK